MVLAYTDDVEVQRSSTQVNLLQTNWEGLYLFSYNKDHVQRNGVFPEKSEYD